MIHLVIYDIEADKARGKIADACEEAGLERVQFSAFWGQMTENECEELLLECEEFLGDEPGRIHIFPLCRQCFERRIHYATARYEGINEQPVDRNANVWFIPDTNESESPSREPAADSVTRARSIVDAQMDVARRLRRKGERSEEPVGLQDDPWEAPDD